jgi:hypothetical protein
MAFPIPSLSTGSLWVRGARTVGPVAPVDPVGRATGRDEAQTLDFGPAAVVTLSEKARSLATEQRDEAGRPQVPTLGACDENEHDDAEDEGAESNGARRTSGRPEEPAGRTAWTAAPALANPKDAKRVTSVFEDPGAAAPTDQPAAADTTDSAQVGDAKGQAQSSATDSPTELSRAEQTEVVELKKRDREVRSHEHAHEAAGGAYSGSASYTYKLGPDGKRYAIAGEVPIDVSGVATDPEATIRKMQTVQRAARAPAEPSGPDLQIAAQAAAIERRARAEVAQARYGAAQAAMTSADAETMIPVQSFSAVG